jgi:hypothetical protein
VPTKDRDEKRRRDAQRRRGRTEDSQEISALVGPIENPVRRKAALLSFRSFCETYFRARFSRPWSDDHLKVIATIEQAVTVGGFFVVAMPRGSGKTSLCEVAAIWAVLTGRHRFVLLVGATKEAALEMLDAIKMELEENELLAADFPREIEPFVLLGGEARKASGQRWKNKRTHIGWKAAEVVFATVPRSKAAGAVLRVAGITGRVRGAKATTPAGDQIRPSLIIPDDSQTDASAVSPLQCDRREKVIRGTLQGAKQQGQALSVLMPITVIARDDLAERFLNAKRNPLWKSERMKMLYAMPERLDLWEQYAAMMADDLAAGGDGARATALYRKNRAEMDRGARAAWEHNFDDDEISAVEHAMRWFLFNRAAFFAECQNDPEEDGPMKATLTAEWVAGKLSGLPRGVVPQNCQHVCAYVDVHSRLLYYAVGAFARDFAGSVIDYGPYPKQPVEYFAQSSAPVAMEAVTPGLVEDAWILAGLKALVDDLLARGYRREDGAEMRIAKLYVDCKWGEKNRLVKAFCARHPQAGRTVWAAQGLGIGAASKPFDEYKPETGAEVGLHWRIGPAKDGYRWVTIDTNWWSSFAAGRLLMPAGTPGGWDLFGTSPRQHALFADHCVAEEPVEVTAKGRTVDEWKWKAGRPDNHYWDCLRGLAAAASKDGARPAGSELWTPPRRGRRKPPPPRYLNL